MIEIQDNGSYNGSRCDSQHGKGGLTIRGKNGCWPIITSDGPVQNFPVLITVEATAVTLERLVAVHAMPAGTGKVCVSNGPSRPPAIVYSLFENGLFPRWHGALEIERCVFFGSLESYARRLDQRPRFGLAPREANAQVPAEPHNAQRFQNLLIICENGFDASGECSLRGCTITGPVHLTGENQAVVDCIMPSVECSQAGARIEHCCVYGQSHGLRRSSEAR